LIAVDDGAVVFTEQEVVECSDINTGNLAVAVNVARNGLLPACLARKKDAGMTVEGNDLLEVGAE
jgi:hypothetical protein